MAGKINWESGDFVDHNALNQIGIQINAAEESEEITQVQLAKQDRIFRGSISTAASTAAKSGTLTNVEHVPAVGELYVIEFTNGNTASSPTLNLNGSGALSLVGASGASSSTNMALTAGVEVLLLHDGDRYRLLTGNQTVYGAFTAAELQTGTSTSTRLVTPALLAQNFLTLNPTVPSSPIDTGRTGQYAFDSNYLYVCVGTNTWRRIPLATW